MNQKRCQVAQRVTLSSDVKWQHVVLRCAFGTVESTGDSPGPGGVGLLGVLGAAQGVGSRTSTPTSRISIVTSSVVCW